MVCISRYILEGKELEFYQKKIQRKKGKGVALGNNLERYMALVSIQEFSSLKINHIFLGIVIKAIFCFRYNLVIFRTSLAFKHRCLLFFLKIYPPLVLELQWLEALLQNSPILHMTIVNLCR